MISYTLNLFQLTVLQATILAFRLTPKVDQAKTNYSFRCLPPRSDLEQLIKAITANNNLFRNSKV